MTLKLASFRIIFTISVFCALKCSAAVNLDTLQAVQVVFRHGARTLQRSYPDDPYNNQSLWPNGFHQLTCIGEVQCYNLGRFLRDRYAGFVNESYIPQEFYTKSSDIDRTIQSATSVIAGFYPPNEAIQENNQNCNLIQWKNIPVHSIPGEFDNMLRQQESCPRYSSLLDDFYTNSPEMKAKIEENLDLLKYIGGNTGVNVSTLDGHTFKLISDIYDALIVERYFNMTLDPWAQAIVGTKQANSLGTFYFKTLTYTQELKQMRAGPLLQYLVDNFDMALAVLNGSYVLTGDDNSGGKPKGRRMNFLSGHDHTLTSLLDTLGIYPNGTRPTFASAVILELHRKSPLEQPYIEIYYRNDSSMPEPYRMELPECATPCYLSNFLELTAPYRLSRPEWSELCLQIPGQRSTLMKGIIWGIVIGSVVIVLITLILLCRSIIRARRQKRNYNSF